MSTRMNLAKQAQIDFMNSKLMGGPFVDKPNNSIFMTESSMQQPSTNSPRLRIQVQPNEMMGNTGGSGARRR